MNYPPIIPSLLDQDLYKYPMAKMIFHRFPGVVTEWRWKSRSKGVDLSPFVQEIETEINHLETLVYEKEEIEYLSDLRYLHGDFIDFLKIYRLRPRDYVKVSIVDGQLDIHIKGPWIHTIFFEVHILSIISEVYTRSMYPGLLTEIGTVERDRTLYKNTDLVNKNYLKWSCFGTRRRFSHANQDYVTKHYVENMHSNFMGTSNVYFAKKYNTTPRGTMAHEIFQVMQSQVRVADSQKFAFENWVQEFRGDLGIALSDIFGVDAFIKDFDLYFAKLFEGVRHDSGDPFTWCEKIIQMYRDLRINPQSKTAVFTDSLTFEKAVEIKDRFNGRIDTAFGIGTNSTNDLGPNYPALQQVLKVTKAGDSKQMYHVAKVSDSPGKGMCESLEHEAWVRHVINEKVKG